jgi:hypothetical protein
LLVALVVEALKRSIFNDAFQPLDLPIGPWVARLGEPVLDIELGEDDLRGPIDCTEEVELALPGPNLGNVDVELADGVALELGAVRLVGPGVRQPATAVALEAAVQAGAGEMRQGGLKGVEAVVERQQRVTAEGNDDGLALGRQDR